MLVSFSISNFMSIGSKQTISMVPSLQKSQEKHLIAIENMTLLKHAVIFGANSSGKSNFIKALALGKQIILEGMSGKFKHGYSKLGPEDNAKITTWEFTYYNNHHFFTYGFCANLNTNVLNEEWLYEINPKTNRNKVVFERNVERKTMVCLIKTTKEEQKRLSIYIEDINNAPHQLFLNEINHHKQLGNNLNIFVDAFAWFNQHLEISLNDQIKKAGSFDQNYQKQFLNMISEFDTGIEDVFLQSLTWESLQEQVPNGYFEDIKKQTELNSHDFGLIYNNQLYCFHKNDMNNAEVFLVFFKHYASPFLFSYSEESEGTKRIFELINLLIENKPSQTYVWDELDRSIHPLVMEKYLEKYLEMTHQIPNQLIFSTHETNILSQDYFRRDEIWFMEKALDQSSKLYSLDIFKERLDKKLSTSYLEGQYGGIPNIHIKDDR
ncbi:MAG: ATP/GTP-binding protein [Bacilli bacterium]